MEKAKVTVEKVQPNAPKPEHKSVDGRISGSHKVKFLPNGNSVQSHNGRNVSLGIGVKLIAAATAQALVDKGLGKIIE